MKISIIIPVYNECNTIEEVLTKVLAVECEKEIIVIDDGSNDGTKEVLNKFSNEAQIYYHERNLGKGAAIRTALQYVKGDIVIVQDADLEYPPEQYPMIIKPIVEGNADVIYGSRFIGTHRVFMFWHYLGNKLLACLANLLYNTMLSDIETGCKVFKKTVFDEITIKSNRFEFEAEITAKVFKKKFRVVEMPITYYGRGYLEGKKITWLDAIPAILTLIKYRFID